MRTRTVSTGTRGVEGDRRKLRDWGRACAGPAAGIAAALLSGVVLLGAAYAYMTDRASTENVIYVGHNVSEIEESYTPPTLTEGVNSYEKSVVVRNKGSVDCFVRVYLAFSDSEAEGHSELSGDGQTWYQAAEYAQHLPAGWISGRDGYYYYARPLKSGEATTALIKSVRTTYESAEEVRSYDLIVYEETVQAKDESGEEYTGEDAYVRAWEAICD